MMQELQKLYQDISVPPTLKEDILTYCRTAEEKPASFVVRYAKPIALVAACVAVLFVSLATTGNLFGGAGLPMGSSGEFTSSAGEEPAPESAVDSSAPEVASTTRGTMRTTTARNVTTTRKNATTTTAPLEGTGGDQDSCEKHVMFYHGINGRLIDYIGSDKVHAYFEENRWLNTSHLTREEREQINIVRFMKDLSVTKQEFVTAMGWEDILDEKPEDIDFGYYNIQYTYREIADAIYSDDQALIDKVFKRESWVAPSTTITTETVTEPTGNVSVSEPVRTTKRAQQ